MIAVCHYCGQPVDVEDRHNTQQAVWGWEDNDGARFVGRRTGSDIIARRRFERFAHRECVRRERSGVSANQVTLL